MSLLRAGAAAVRRCQCFTPARASIARPHASSRSYSEAAGYATPFTPADSARIAAQLPGRGSAAPPHPGGPRNPLSPQAYEPPTSPRFSLLPSFLDRYAGRPPPFGFNGLGEFVFVTRYARLTPSGRRETWTETCTRVVEGCFNMQRRWVEAQGTGWNPWRAQSSAQDMFDRIWNMKMLPPGRGLWAMGTPITEEKGLYAALNNCAFTSTEKLAGDPTRPFAFLMDAAMLGVGVGFDTRGAGTVCVAGPAPPAPGEAAWTIPDSREGWVESFTRLLHAHFTGAPRPVFDYTRIRPRGAPIRGFGGTAAGPEVLARLHNDVDKVLAPLAGGKPLTVTAIVDVMNVVGRCVVSGEVRQTAEIAFSEPTPEYLGLKDYDLNPARAEWGWTSNNSVFAELGMDYGPVAAAVAKNGEPGLAWLHNMRAYGRMCDPPTWVDHRVSGGNPCLEQSLESYEACCLVETFPDRADNMEDFLATLRAAFLYAKTVTLGGTHWPEVNRIMLRNRRIGTSISGVAQFLGRRGLGELQVWCEAGVATVRDVDARLSEWLAIPRSIKTTCVKPSGTVSLLAGATPGMHYPEARFYLRRVRLGADNPLVGVLRSAGYSVEPAVEDPTRKVVVAFPVDAGAGVRVQGDVGMWEQFSLAAFLQRWWADNQVSATITFDPATEGRSVVHALEHFQWSLKGVSLLPRLPAGAYAQMPYEAITEAAYASAVANLRGGGSGLAGLLAGDGAAGEHAAPDAFCDSAGCAVVEEIK